MTSFYNYKNMFQRGIASLEEVKAMASRDIARYCDRITKAEALSLCNEGISSIPANPFLPEWELHQHMVDEVNSYSLWVRE